MSGLTPDELTYLHQVLDHARSGATAELETALAAGVPVNLTSGAGDSLLMLASYYNHPDAVSWLLAAGADPERVNDQGQTALGAAVFRRCRASIVALLAAGADPDHGARSARTIAAFFDLTEMQAMLPTPAP